MNEKHYIYIDEKGPQEYIGISNKKIIDGNTPQERFSLGDDQMLDYIMVAVDIPDSSMQKFELEFINLENTFKSSIGKNQDFELKGKYLVKKKNLSLGLASLPKRETDYYLKILDLFNKYNVQICLIDEYKIESIMNGRLSDWILSVSGITGMSYQLLDYSFVKYVSIESSIKVREALLSTRTTITQILDYIAEDMQDIITKNENNNRMSYQLDNYKIIVKLINMFSKLQVTDPKISGEFEWSKIKYSLTLWLDERTTGSQNEYILNLDEGIKVEDVKNDYFKRINSNLDSKANVGIRCADLVAALVGKLITKLNLGVIYDPNNPDIRKVLDENFFLLNDYQIELAKQINKLIFLTNHQYGIVISSYFDNFVNFESYVEYLSRVRHSNELSNKKNSEDQFKVFCINSTLRFNEMKKTDILLKSIGMTPKEAIESGLMKPL